MPLSFIDHSRQNYRADHDRVGVCASDLPITVTSSPAACECSADALIASSLLARTSHHCEKFPRTEN
jgi:hypothetical protein